VPLLHDDTLHSAVPMTTTPNVLLEGSNTRWAVHVSLGSKRDAQRLPNNLDGHEGGCETSGSARVQTAPDAGARSMPKRRPQWQTAHHPGLEHAAEHSTIF
jgi:hypothetical protein